MGLNNSVSAVCMCSILLAHGDDQVEWFEYWQVPRLVCKPQQWCQCCACMGYTACMWDNKAVPPLSWAALASSEAHMWSPTVVLMPVCMWVFFFFF